MEKTKRNKMIRQAIKRCETLLNKVEELKSLEREHYPNLSIGPFCTESASQDLMQTITSLREALYS